MAEILNISRDNPLIRIPRTWIDDIYPPPLKTLKMIREIDGDKIIILPLVNESIEAAINSNKGEQTNEKAPEDERID